MYQIKIRWVVILSCQYSCKDEFSIEELKLSPEKYRYPEFDLGFTIIVHFLCGKNKQHDTTATCTPVDFKCSPCHYKVIIIY